MKATNRAAVCALLMLGLIPQARGQSAAAPATLPAAAKPPATAPATMPAPYVLIVPPGMQVITVGERNVVCMPENADAVRAALAKVAPSTRPSTGPSDMLLNLASARESLIVQMTGDMGVSKDLVVSFLDDTLKTELTEMSNIKPKAYILAATEPQVTAAIKSGWHAPQFHYNIDNGKTQFSPAVQIIVGGPPSDVVVWSELEPADTAADVTGKVTTTYQNFERSFPASNALNSMAKTREKFLAFISYNVMAPLKLPVGESWIGRGLLFNLGSKYTAVITGLPRTSLVNAMVMDSPGNPIHTATLDLAVGIDPSVIRPEYLSAYYDAVSHKSTGVVQKILNTAGDSVIPKILAELKANVPPTNADMIQLVKKITGVDVTEDLKAKS